MPWPTVIPNVNTGAPAYFLAGVSFPAGNYVVAYDTGCLQYAFNGLWDVNYVPGIAEFHIVNGAGGNQVVGPGQYAGGGSPSLYTTQAAAVAASAGLTVAYAHTGGKLGLFCVDTDYADNTPSPTYGAPQFHVEGPPFVGSFTAVSPVLFGRSTTLNWVSYLADVGATASIDHGVGTVPTSGSISFTPVASVTLTLTVTNAYGTATATVTIIVYPLREIHLFSTGTLFTGTGAEFALLQDIVMTPVRSQAAKLYECSWLSPFPVDVGFSNSSCVLVATYAGINHDALQEALGTTETTGGGSWIEMIPEVLTRTPFTLICTTQDTEGKQQVWTFNAVYLDAGQIPAKLDNFAMPHLTMAAYKDDAGNVATISIPW